MAKTIGKYEIVSKVGVGSMGAVYKAIDPLIQRKVAIKTIKKELLSSAEDYDLLKRFQQEAQAIGQLHHPNITAIYEYGEDSGETFIAMTFAEGRDLKSYFDKQEKFSLEAICHMMEQLLDALAFSHKHNIYHRDIKPANIIVQDDGSIMVTDFGIARLESSELTQAGTVMGTPSYMSPEQLIGQRVDGRTDIFSSGVILYQFLTGEKPFTGSTVASIMHKIMNLPHVPPSDIDMTIPSYFDDILSKCLAKKRDERYANAEDFKKDINWAAAKLKEGTKSFVSEQTLVLPVKELDQEPGDSDNSVYDETVVLPSVADTADEGTVVLPSMGAQDPPVDEDVTTVLPSTVPAEGVTQGVHPSKAVVEPEPVSVDSSTSGATKPNFPIKKAYLGGVAVALCVIVIVFFSLSSKKDGNLSISPPDSVVAQAPKNVQVVAKAQLEVLSQPVGAKVLLNDKEMDMLTPLKMDLENKQYTLVLQKDGYHDLVILFDGEAGKDINLKLNMHSL